MSSSEEGHIASPPYDDDEDDELGDKPYRHEQSVEGEFCPNPSANPLADTMSTAVSIDFVREISY